MKNLFAIAWAVFLLGTGTTFADTLWIEDFEAAKKLSSQTGKDILVDVTGSDWCPPCIRMEDEVFSRNDFRQKAPQIYVLVRLDYPRKIKQDEKTKLQNQRLAEKYPFSGYPSYFLMDKTGKPYGMYTGYLPGGTKAFFQLLSDFATQKTTLTQLQNAANQAPGGVEKAKALHALYSKADDWNLGTYYSDLPSKILQEDKDDKAGLKTRYQVWAEYAYLLNSWTEQSDFSKAANDVQKLADRSRNHPDLQQKILFTQGLIYLNALTDQPRAREIFLKVKAIQPSSAVGKKAAELLVSLP